MANLPMKQVYQRKKPMSLSIQPFTPNALSFFAPATRARLCRVRPALVATLVLWRARRRTRQQLSSLGDRTLADVGLTRTQQRDECAKPFWQP